MASKMKCRKKTEKSESSLSSNSETDDFQPNSNIASKINVRRMPKRTPTAHVKANTEEAKRRSSKVQQEPQKDPEPEPEKPEEPEEPEKKAEKN